MAKEIFYCNLTILHNNKPLIIKEVIYKETDGFYHNKKMFNNPVKVIKIDVIKSLGFENISNGHIEVQKSQEQRNIITGAYD